MKSIIKFFVLLVRPTLSFMLNRCLLKIYLFLIQIFSNANKPIFKYGRPLRYQACEI